MQTISENNLNGLGKLPPQALEFERAILGAMMIESSCMSKVLGRIKNPDVFYLESHQVIFSCMVELFNDSMPVDLLMVTQQLRRKSQLEQVGGVMYLAKLTESVNSAANIESHTVVVYQQYVRRQLIKASSTNLERAYDESYDVMQLLENMQSQAIKLTNVISSRQVTRLGDMLSPAIKEIENAMSQPDGVTGVASGIKSIDKVTGGWQNSDLIIIAARPAMGKTTMVLNFLRNAALDSQTPVLIFSLEMSSMQLTKKVLSMQAGMTTNQLVKGRVTEAELRHLTNKASDLMNVPLFIDDTAGISIEQLRAKCIAQQLKHGIRMVVVDYLQLVNGSGRGSREQEISQISRGLKMIAKDLNIPVIALSQLSRAVEQRPDKRPMLSDLRESGAIEQDADMVCFLYRPGYYGIEQDESGNSTENVIEFILSKHRNGALANLNLKEELKYSRIHDWDDYRPQVMEEVSQSAIHQFNGAESFEKPF